MSPARSQAISSAPVPLNNEKRQALLLRVWEAVSKERELQGVLSAVTEVLSPVVPYASLGIVSFEDGTHDLYALHVTGVIPREGETVHDTWKRAQVTIPKELPHKPLEPYSPDMLESAHLGAIGGCADLFAKDTWYEHEFHLAASGIRAYAAIPLIVGGDLIGTASFCRTRAIGFSDVEKDILRDVARALAVAVANALANEEIRDLRDQLQAENIALRAQLCLSPFEEIIGDSEALRRVLASVEQVAETEATVLITGETGTGKELVARAIHRRSPRAHGPLVKLNCGAVPESLLASELFGHERGAFTGALERRKGRFEQANGGTLFLDEIGEMPLDTQVMLLRVLQEREFERLGGSQTMRADVRVIAATNRHLLDLVQEGKFRSDLYYRLSVFPVHMPPLRERIDDIPLLVAHFAAKHSEKLGRAITRIESRTLRLLQAQRWPGNVRELENVIERAVILARNGALKIDREMMPEPGLSEGGIHEKLRTQEKTAIEAALQASHGRVSGADGAAKRLGLAASTLEFRIRRLGIDKFRFRSGQ